MAGYLLDTNVLSEPLRPAPNPLVVAAIQRHLGEIAVPATVWHELRYGVAIMPPGKRRHAVETYLREGIEGVLPIVPYDARAAAWHAAERARLRAAGLVPPFADGQLASIAAVNDLVLVTANAKDFRDFEGLRLADWRVAA